MNRAFSLRKRVHDGETVYGTFCKINSPDIVEMIGNAGYDFIIIDMEHANFSPLDTANLIRAADSALMSSVVRVSQAQAEDVLHALDSGADGVQIPSITSLSTAETVCRSAKYFPEGSRGLSATQRSAMYGAWNKAEGYYAYANTHSLVVVHVENLEMAECVEALCEIPAIDVVFVGPGDLSQALGKPGQMRDPEVVALVEGIIGRVKSKGKAAGVFCGNSESVDHYRALGATYFAYSSDTTLFANALAAAKKQLP